MELVCTYLTTKHFVSNDETCRCMDQPFLL